MSAPPVITAAAAGFRYAGQHQGVGPFDIAVRPGELHLITGRSGCGKSTLARMLCGIIPHLYRGEATGRIEVAGRPSTATPLWALMREVGFVGQNPAAQLLASTVRQEIVFGLENLGLGVHEIAARTAAVLTDFGLQGLAARDPRGLSGGEQQRLVLAAIMARRPRALVLDEPLSMLDTASSRRLVGDLDRARNHGCAVIVFEHRSGQLAQLPDIARHRLPPADPPGDCVTLGAAPLPPVAVAADGLWVELGGRTVLRDVRATFAGGEVVAVVGANGSGKTTLLRALVGLQPHRGMVTGTVGGMCRRPQLGLCFDNPDRQLFNPTVRQELLYGLPAHDEELYSYLVQSLGLTAYENTSPLLLSEGEKKRVALATVLLRPGLHGVCLDEPTLGQDGQHRRLLGSMLKQLAGAGYLVLVATHDLDWAVEWCDRIACLRGGRLEAGRTPEAILHDPALGLAAGLCLPEEGAEPCRLDQVA